MVGWGGLLAIVIISQRISELYIAKHNRIWALAAGAQEFGTRHYPLFFLLHIGWLIGWTMESSLRGGAVSELWKVWFSLFVIAQGLRYWCMVSLGRLWNTRILVIPGGNVVCKGPYRFLSHPNYLAVTIELVSIPLIFGAVTTAILATLLNAMLILGIRLPEERRALRLLKQIGAKGV
jgi:methyltransferase